MGCEKWLTGWLGFFFAKCFFTYMYAPFAFVAFLFMFSLFIIHHAGTGTRRDILGGWRVGLTNSSPVLNFEEELEQGRAPD